MCVEDCDGLTHSFTWFQAIDLSIDESSFTGETQSVTKMASMQNVNEKNSISQRRNIAYMGTLVRTGRGKVCV